MEQILIFVSVVSTKWECEGQQNALFTSQFDHKFINSFRYISKNMNLSVPFAHWTMLKTRQGVAP